MDSVSPEIAEEVGVLFEYLDPATCTSEQQPRHHARWSAADYDEVEAGILPR
jgi:hypothetical protein